MKIINILLICCLTLFIGCKETEIILDGGSATKICTTQYQDKVALICNLTKVDPTYYDGWNGDCPGTDVDANNFTKMCKENNIYCIKYQNSECTNQNIIDTWKKCISILNPTNGLFVFYYSGHGGQVYSSTESDGLDETLCFWNGQMRDDTVWALLNMVPKTCRIFMVTDCCNSGTNYQLPYNPTKRNMFSRSQSPNLIHFGGCNDGESSYGSSRGGSFTLALKKTYNLNLTYLEWFNKAKQNMNISYQVPTYAETGKSFHNTKIFK